MAAYQDRGSILEWDGATVQDWFTEIGLPNYEYSITEHGISGEVLTMMNHDSLKEIGVTSVGHRLAILKGVYQIKAQEEIPLDPEHYIPPSEVAEAAHHGMVTLENIAHQLREQGDRIIQLEKDNQRLHEELQMITAKESVDSRGGGLRKQPSFKWAQYKPAKSPTRLTADATPESPRPMGSPVTLEHEISPPRDQPSLIPTATRSQTSSATPPTPAAQSAPRAATATTPAPTTAKSGIPDVTDIRSFKVSLEDPAWKVLPAALKKYKINNDDWQNYAMFICYGNTERCLSYDEKPLLLFQKLKDAKKNPVFMLKHIKDIRSPIAVAQQKQQARMTMKQPSASALSKSTSARLQSSAPKTGTNGGQWPEVMSPTVGNSDPPAHPPGGAALEFHGIGQGRENNIPLTASVSYAIAIYPYMAEQEDEFDVAVNDTFIILSRAQGWWVVQRDPQGTGRLEGETSRQGWVPAGCLLETSVPVATAIADATSSGGASTSKSPILPLSIISTSFPGIALMGYGKMGDEELTLTKDDALRVFKRYNHWSYAVKEDGGDRGWVPSWFIGKLGSTAPGTPGNLPNTSSSNMNSMMASIESELRYAGGSLDTAGLLNGASSPVSPGFSGFSMGRTTSTMI